MSGYDFFVTAIVFTILHQELVYLVGHIYPLENLVWDVFGLICKNKMAVVGVYNVYLATDARVV